MTSSIDNLTAIAADLNAAGKTVKVTVLKPLSLIHISEPTRPY